MINILRYIRHCDLSFLQFVKCKEFYQHLTNSPFARHLYVAYNIHQMHVTDMNGNIVEQYIDLDKNNIELNNFCFI